ncbi:hypothetical protein ACFL5U_04135, partial [Candidatus Margulisiibacteriota bacterium]
VREQEAITAERMNGKEAGGIINLFREGIKNLSETPTKTLAWKFGKNLFFLACASAAVYGVGAVVGLQISATFALEVASLVSTAGMFACGNLWHINPSSQPFKSAVNLGKTWGLLLSTLGFLTVVPYMLFKAQYNISNLFAHLPSWGLYGIIGGVALVILYKIISQSFRYVQAHKSMVDAPDKAAGIKTIILAKLGLYAKLGLLTYITPMYLAALYGFMATLSASLAPALITIPTTVLGAYYIGKWALNKNRSVEHGMFNFMFGLGLGTVPLLISGGFLTAFAFPTLFLIAPWCMILVSYHAGLAAMSSATNHERAAFYPGTLPIPDHFKNLIAYGLRGGKGRKVIRFNPFMANVDTNLSNLFNMLIMPYPDVSTVTCEEGKPWIDTGQLQQACARLEFMEYKAAKQKEIYDFIHKHYERLDKLDRTASDYEARLEKEYEILAWVFRRIGNQMVRTEGFVDISPVDGKTESVRSFYDEIKQVHEEDALSLAELQQKPNRLQTQRRTEKKWFDQDLDPLFFAEQYSIMRHRAESFFLPMAELAAKRARDVEIKGLDIKKEYLRLLDIYASKDTYVLRRIEHHDDNINQKTYNICFIIVHSGDTLCPVEVLTEDGREHYTEHVPCEYIRVDNPENEHNDKTRRFFWIHRDDAKKQNPLLEFSQSGSEEIERIQNKPTGQVEQQGRWVTVKEGKYKGTRVFETDLELLPVRDILLRDYEKDNTTAVERIQDRLVWAPGLEKCRLTGWDASTRHAVTQTLDRFEYDRAYLTMALPKYMDVKDKDEDKALTKLLDKYESVGRQALAQGLDPLQEYLKKHPGDKLGKYLKITGGKLWYRDPELLVLDDVTLNDYIQISDEEYIDFASAIQLQSELQHDAEQQKNVRVNAYIPTQH